MRGGLHTLVLSSHLISSLLPTHLPLLERLRTDALDHAFIYAFIYASTHPRALTSKRRSPTYLPTYPRTHDRAGRAQEFPNDDAVKPASARNEGAHAQKERLGAPESSGRQSFLAS
jgi:hypothetical protein